MKMKKRNLFFALLVIGGLSTSNAQSYKHSIGLSYGAAKNGNSIMLSHNYFLNFHDNIETSLLISRNEYRYKDTYIPSSTISITSGYSKNILFNKRNSFRINGAAGLLIGYESLNKNQDLNGSELLNDSNPIFGGYLGIDIDYALNDKFSLFTKANQYYHINSDLGNSTSFIGGGLRFYIN